MTRLVTETIASAGQRLRSGATTSADLTSGCLAAIAEHGPRTNAFITVHDTSAAKAAARADEELRAGLDRGPLHGIPVSLKDLIDEAGLPNTAGSKALDDRVPTVDAPLVARLRDAGAVIIGRTNLHEFALGTTSEDSGFGPVRNPYDESRSPGGSSGGSAAAVATGMSFGSIGTDTGGSVRIPAAACGLVGLKPSSGEVPIDGIVPLSGTLDHAGPLALSVQDAAWLWQIMSGRAPAEIRAKSPERLTLARLVGYYDMPLDPVVRDAFDVAISRLTGAGVHVASAEVDETAIIGQTYADIVLAEAAHWHAPILESRKERYCPAVYARIAHGRTVTAVNYLAGLDACSKLSRRISLLLDTSDALVLPTLPITAPVLGQADIVVDPASGTSLPVRAVMLKHTQLFNLTGHPAISLPVASGSLPVGLQLVGRIGRTDELLAIAAACEQMLQPAR